LEDRCLLSFGLATNYDTSYGPRSVDVGDFNGDGRADVVSATLSGIAVRLNHGNGTLASEVLYPLGQDPITTVVGDLNGDGKLDVVATTGSVDKGCVRVLLGNGNGTFAVSPAIYDVGDPRPFEAVLGDLDADGDLDLVLSNLDGSASVLLGNGNGTFAPRQAVAILGTRDVDLADLNGDGKLDLITGSAFGNTVCVLQGNGDGTFQAAQTVASFTVDGQPVTSINQSVGDINDDGTLDLAVTYNAFYGFNDGYDGDVSWAVGSAAVLLGNGDGTFANGNSYLIGPGYIGRDLVADFTDDGTLDIATSGYDAGNVSLLRGNGDGTFNSPEPFPVERPGGGPYDIASADLDGNGSLDLATANYGWNTLSVLLNGVSPLPALSIGDLTINEGSTGTRAATFTVTLSVASSQPVTVGYATANGTATANSDYQAASGALTFAPGETSKTITVLLIGDRLPEPNETFFVNLSSPTNATIADGQGIGTILDDEPRINISDVSKSEGRRNKSTSFTFTITLSAAYDQPVTVSYRTVDGTAKTSDGDYVAKSGTITFKPGETTKTITIAVKGDSKKETDETFYLDLFGNSSNSLITKNRGIGTILNDD
jgi:hypothetical protein